ncbi:hypothetical protein [Natrinema salaciae]|uniref:Uncharacterized protein n=1 Tax=Natrinema salaciae TaxID=1186196 RepID=A0A1H9M3K4_9EURY|nr:hypothetical protein [Natrinema salaciae]SER18224.1 hypothetical protein SAMN04489841_3189 [Natrinema salaciae]
MTSRRSLVRTIGTAVAGTATLVGRSLASTARSGRTATGRSDGTASAPTTLTVSADRSAVRAAGVPSRLAPVVDALENRIDAVSLADVDGLAGTAGVDGSRLVDGTVVVTGSFDGRALRRELRQREFTAVGTSGGLARFVSGDGRVAVGAARSVLVLGYGPGTGLERVDAARPTRHAVAATARRSSPALGHLDRVLGGNAVVTADLGAAGRSGSSPIAGEVPAPFAEFVGAADAAGAAATVRPGRDRVGLRCALVAEPNRLSVDRVRAAIDDVDTGPDSVRVDSLERVGRTIVVDGDAPLERLFRASEEAIAGSSTGGERGRQSSAGNARSDESC